MTKIIKILCVSFLLLISCENENAKSSEKESIFKELGIEDLMENSDLNESELIGKSFTLYNIFSDININISFYDTNNWAFGFAGANTYRGSYSKNNDEIKFSDISRTKMTGPKEIMDAENEFIKDLENAKYMFLNENELIIITSDSKILRFRENIINIDELKDIKFRLSNIFEETDLKTLYINNNSFVGNSGVNFYNIPFKLNNNEIIIEQSGLSTLMAGAEDDMKSEDEYLNLINSAKYISFDNYNLCIKTADNQLLLFDIVD